MNTSSQTIKRSIGLLIILAAWLDQYFHVINLHAIQHQHLPTSFLVTSGLYLIVLYTSKSELTQNGKKAKGILKKIQYLLIGILFLITVVEFFMNRDLSSIVDVACVISTLILAVIPEKLLDAVFDEEDVDNRQVVGA